MFQDIHGEGDVVLGGLLRALEHDLVGSRGRDGLRVDDDHVRVVRCLAEPIEVCLLSGGLSNSMVREDDGCGLAGVVLRGQPVQVCSVAVCQVGGDPRLQSREWDAGGGAARAGGGGHQASGRGR
jgi:hypothetical protein